MLYIKKAIKQSMLMAFFIFKFNLLTAAVTRIKPTDDKP